MNRGRSTLAQVAWLLVGAMALLLLVAALLLRSQGIAGGLAQVLPLVRAQQVLVSRWLAQRETAGPAEPQLRNLGLQVATVPPPGAEGGYPFPQAVAAALRAELGSTRVVLREGPPQTVWLVVRDGPEPLWLGVPLPRQMDRVRDSALLWLAGAAVVILLTAARIAGRLTRPLRSLAAQAPALVRGEVLDSAPLTGAPDEVRALADQLAQAGQAQRQAVRERDLMLAGLSHDLRSPLARLRFAVELGDHGDGADTAGTRAMVADIEELDALLEQFIRFARGGEAAEMAVIHQPAALLSALKTTRRSDAPWHWQLPGPLEDFQAPPLGLRRALVNLLDNAERHGQPPFVCTLTADAQVVQVAIRDHGPGLDAATVERLRQPFVRGTAARTGPGSGLGLAIVDRFAASIGGQLSLTRPSDGSPGLIATLRWPRINPPYAPTKRSTSTSQSA